MRGKSIAFDLFRNEISTVGVISEAFAPVGDSVCGSKWLRLVDLVGFNCLVSISTVCCVSVSPPTCVAAAAAVVAVVLQGTVYF